MQTEYIDTAIQAKLIRGSGGPGLLELANREASRLVIARGAA